MIENEILLTTPCFPYPTLPFNDALTDAMGQRFSKGDDIYTVISHTHCYANHILAQNVTPPTTVLEYPRWEDFDQEVRKGYPYLGISAFPPHLDTVMRMCTHVRKVSPHTKILLGSYAAQAFDASYDEETKKKYVDHVVIGEGVRFMRELLGEPLDRPIEQVLMPKAGGSLPWIDANPGGSVGFLVSGLGCIGGCDFCSTTAMYGKKRVELLDPQQLVDSIEMYHRHFPDVMMVFVIEEDHFRCPGHLARMREHWMAHPDLNEHIDLFTFGSVDAIAAFARKHGWQAILEAGVGCVFIGVESKFAGEHGYDKRDDVDAKDVFDRLHAMGIRTVGAWMCGWDFHHHGNMYEDLNYFVSLRPTYQQLTRVSPFPGTPLWDRLRQEGRVQDVPWEDVHFWSGAQKNVNLENHETLNLIDEGYRLLYRTWGPSLMRRLDVQLEGYAYCRASDNPVLRRHKAKFFKQQAALFRLLVPACDRYAPNGAVRRRIRKLDEKYRAYVGEPTPIMESLAALVDKLVVYERVRELISPRNRTVKEEPFKRYVYDRRSNDRAIPYRVERPRRDRGYELGQTASRTLWHSLHLGCEGLRRVRPKGGDPEIDDYLLTKMERAHFGFGF